MGRSAADRSRKGHVEVVVDHEDRAVVRLGDCYLKVESDPQKAAREHRVLQLAPVPVPEVLWFRPGAPSVTALAALEGSPLSASDDAADWRAAGRVLAALHRTTAPEWPSWFDAGEVCGWIDADRRWLVERGLLSPQLGSVAHDAAVECLRTRECEPVLTHRDLQSDHVMVRDGEVTGVLDWGDVGVGDPLYDVAVLTSAARHRLDDVLAGYGTVDRGVVTAWWIERYLGEARWLVEHDVSPDSSLARLELLVG